MNISLDIKKKKKKHVLPARIFFSFFHFKCTVVLPQCGWIKIVFVKGFLCLFHLIFFCDYKVWSGVICYLSIYKILINLKKVNCTWHSHGHSHNVVMQLKSSLHDGILFLIQPKRRTDTHTKDWKSSLISFFFLVFFIINFYNFIFLRGYLDLMYQVMGFVC